MAATRRLCFLNQGFRLLLFAAIFLAVCVLPTVRVFADPYDIACVTAADCALYDPNNDCGTTSTSTGASISGDVKSLAQQILDNSKISFDYGLGGPTGTQFKRLASGDKAQTDDGRAVEVQPIVLVVILHIAQSHKVNISALTDGSSHTAPTNPHGAGKAVDINILDGSHTSGTDDVADKITSSAAEVLPDGSRLGLGANGGQALGTKKIGGKTFATFVDSSTHVHIDVLGVDQSKLDAAVQAGGSGTAPSSDTGGGAQCCSAGGSTNLTGDTTGEAAMNYLTKKGLSKAGAAGAVGNMTLESIGVEPQRLQNHISEKIPADKIPPGETGAGYGIVQWTPAKDKILKAANPVSKAGDLTFQLDYLWNEITHGYSGMVAKLKNINDPQQAADIFLNDFENPRDPSATQTTREAYATAYYNLATKGTPLPPSVPMSKLDGGSSSSGGCASSSSSGTCKVTAPAWGAGNGGHTQYTLDQFKSIFGDPGTVSSHPEIDKNLVDVDFNGHKVQVHKLAADCLKAVAQEIKDKGISYTIKDMGCYRFDSDNGSSNIGLKSYHTYGAACDINPSSNPFIAGGGSAPHDMPDEYVQIFHDHGFTWGGSWNSVKDYMHFEFNGVKPN